MHNPFYNRNQWKVARAVAKERDGYACTQCGRTGVPLDVDHILDWKLYPDLAFSLDNLRTLCRRCHNRRTHGRKTSRRAQTLRRRNSRRW